MIKAIQLIQALEECDEVTSCVLMANNDVIITYFTFSAEKREVRVSKEGKITEE